jgi:integrase
MVGSKRVAKTFPTKAEAEAYRAELAESIARGIRVDSDSFGAISAAWLEHVQATTDARTFDSYNLALRPFAHLSSVSTSNVTVVALQKVLDSLDGRTAQLAHDKVRQCVRWAIRKQLLQKDLTAGLDRPKHERAQIEPFTLDEIRLILQKSEHLRYHAAIHLVLMVGLRGGEVWGLQWGDLDGYMLSVQRQAAENAGNIVVKTPKKTSGRTIALPDCVVDALKSIERPTLSPDDWMFPDARGNVTRRSNFSARVWKPLLKACNLRPRGFHHCRHTAATMMLNSGVPITTVAATLGHKDAATTLSIYSHLMTTELTTHRNRLADAVRAS